MEYSFYYYDFMIIILLNKSGYVTGIKDSGFFILRANLYNKKVKIDR